MQPTIFDVVKAQARLRPFLQPTPLRPSRWLRERSGGPVWLKLESLNLTHSFKIRGAFNALLRLVEAHPDPGRRPVVVTASAGNHGRAIACAAEGYAFPTNLDHDQPIGSLAPPSQVDTVLAALADDLAANELDTVLAAQNERRIP